LIVYLDHPALEALFVGTALVATSVGITARVPVDMALIQKIESRIILGAAVIDDIISIVILAVVSRLGEGHLSWVRIAPVAVEAIGFTISLAFVGSRVIHNTLTFRMLYAFHEECVCSSPTMRWWTKGSIAREDA